jgi:hypothetical protein
MKLKHINLLLCIAVAMISSCGERKTPELVDKKKQEFKLPNDIVKFPYKRVDMEMDSLPTTIEVTYGHVACPCAQWIIDDKSSDGREYIYVEPANTEVKDAESLLYDYWVVQLKLTGKFYKQPGYPIGYDPVKGNPDPARVFRYSKLKVVKLTPIK